MRPCSNLAIVAVAFTCAGALAQTTTTIHKCQLPDGSYIYSSTECGGGEILEITTKEPDPANQPVFDLPDTAPPPGALPPTRYASTFENYELSVERIDADFYRMRTEEGIIHAPYCLELLGGAAILSLRGIDSKLFFLNSGGSCDVESVFLPTSERSGDYRLTLDREDSNLYLSTDGAVLVETRRCRERARRDDALLMLDGGRFNITLQLPDEACEVEAVYERIQI